LPVSAGAHSEADPEPAALLALREHGDAATEMVAVPALGVGDRGDDGANEPMIAQTPRAGPEKIETESESDEDYGPRERFNQAMFGVSRSLDRLVLNARGHVYRVAVPGLAPVTGRDGIGRGVDALMHPLSYVVPFIWTGLAMKVGEVINDRALNLDLFQGLEESVVDLYSAVRNGYLRRREQMIKE